MTSRPSSAIQQDIELEVFKASFFQEKVEALRQQILDLEEKAQLHESNAREIASAEFGVDLVEPSLQMAKLSVPFLKEKFKSRTQLLSSGDIADSEDVRAEQSSTPEDTREVSHEIASPDSGADIDTEDNADTDATEFFGVEVPPSRRDEARDIIDEAIAAVRKKSKTNIYASGRGKNAWRKHLFAAAWSHFANNDTTSETSDASPRQSHEKVDEAELDASVIDEGFEKVSEEPAIKVDDVSSSHDTEEAEVSTGIPEFDAPEDTDSSEEFGDESVEDVNSEEENSFDDWTMSEDNDVIIAGLDDDMADETAYDISTEDASLQSDDFGKTSTASDHVTLSIEDTFFPDQGVSEDPLVAVEEHDEPSVDVAKPDAVSSASNPSAMTTSTKTDHRIAPTPRPRVAPPAAPPSDFSISEKEKEDFLARRAVSGASQNPAMKQDAKADNGDVDHSRSSSSPSGAVSPTRQPLHRPTVPPKPAPIAQVARKPGYGNAVPTAPPGLQEAVAHLKATESSTHPVAKSADAPPVPHRPVIAPRPIPPAREQSSPAPTASNGSGRPMPFNRPNFSATRK